MEDLFGLINGALSGSPTNDYSAVFQSNYVLFGLTMFVDLFVTMVSMVLFYDTVKSYIATRRASLPASSPINLYKIMIMCASAGFFLRSVFDAIILVSWGELSTLAMRHLHDMDKIADISSSIPFMGAVYILFRAGPVIEYQLLRQPIPTDLHPTWKMLRKPITSIALIILLSVVITISK